MSRFFVSSIQKFSFVIPNLERDLTHCIREELSTMQVSSLLAPQVFGYIPTSSSSKVGGAYRGSSSVQYDTTTKIPVTMIKIELPIPTKQGLCHG